MRGKKLESILFNERLTDTWDPDCIMLTETCNHKERWCQQLQ